MKLGRVVLFVQFAALWKICPSFHPVPKLLEKKKKKVTHGQKKLAGAW